jgi:CheY-like chemotaxis protein
MTATDERILLVEDNEDDVLLVRRAVEYLGGTGRYAGRGRHPPPALLLLDLKLPRRSGLEVLAWLRQQPALRRLPVVVLTSSQEPSEVGRAYDLGANTYIMKPVEFDALLEVVRTLHLYWMVLAERPAPPPPEA